MVANYLRRPLCVYDISKAGFDREKGLVSIVCVGDSIAGWNNFRPQAWPFLTYPQVLQSMLPKRYIANFGVAGEFSRNGAFLVDSCLGLFPNARVYVVGFGTNDLAFGRLDEVSEHIIGNLDCMVRRICATNARPVLINVPHVNEFLFPPDAVRENHHKRDYHNAKLAEFFSGRVPVVDICSKLRDEHFGDSLHPNADGAKIIAKEVYRAVMPLLR